MFGNVAFSQAPFDAFAGAVYLASVDETATGADAISSLHTYGVLLSDGASAAEVYETRLPISVNVQIESATATDAYATIATVRANAVETASGQDTPVMNGALRVAVGELVTATDVVRMAASFPVSRAEAATGTDSQVGRRVLLASVADTVGAQDAVSSLPNYRVLYAETATATETLDTRVSVLARAIELAYAQDILTTNTAVNATRGEASSASVNNMAGLRYTVRLQENATIFDQPVGRRLWEPVPDTQDPNWVIIPTTPT